MALKNSFYSEIFTNEQRWIDMIDHNLLNSIYCNFALKPFYLEKRAELENEYRITNNEILRQIILIIDKILIQISLFDVQYKNLEYVDIRLLRPLFLVNQMNNVSQKRNDSFDTSNEYLGSHKKNI